MKICYRSQRYFSSFFTFTCFFLLSTHGLVCQATITIESNVSAFAQDDSNFPFFLFDGDQDMGAGSVNASASAGAGNATASVSVSSAGGTLMSRASGGNGSTISSSSSAGIRLSENDPLDYFAEGVWAASGNGTFSFPLGTRSNGSGTFMIELLAEFSTSAALNGSATAIFTIRRRDEPTPPLPGESDDDEILLAVGADLSQLRSLPYTEISPTVSTPAMIAGINLQPVHGDHGVGSPLFFGSPRGTTNLQAPLANLAFASASTTSEPAVVGYGYQVDDNLFTHFTLPFAPPGGDTDLSIVIDGQTIPYTVGETLDFTQYVPGGVDIFSLLDLDGGPVFDPSEPVPFVSGLQFANNGLADLLIVALVPVPEPSALLLAVLGMFCIVLRHKDGR